LAEFTIEELFDGEKFGSIDRCCGLDGIELGARAATEAAG
jgi:hypothetical protein